MDKDKILLRIKHDVEKHMREDPPTHQTLREGFVALAVLMDALVAFDAKQKQHMYVLLEAWLEEIISDDLYEALAHVNGATIKPEPN